MTTLIPPCRLLDTRLPPYGVGARHTPLGAGETFTASIAGCAIPQTATGIIANVTVVNPTADSHLTVWPAGQARPNTSNLNWSAGQAPVANQVTTALSADFRINMFSPNGTVDVIVDITGYLAPADLSNYYTKAQVDAAVAAAASCKGYPHIGIDWHGCDLAGANLVGANLYFSDLHGANLRANLTSANLQTSNMTGVDLTGANLTSANLGFANLTNAYAVGVNLPNANLTNANLNAANLTGADLTNANFTNANLTDANLLGANVTGVVWSNTTCPDGTNSNNDSGTCVGHP